MRKFLILTLFFINLISCNKEEYLDKSTILDSATFLASKVLSKEFDHYQIQKWVNDNNNLCQDKLFLINFSDILNKSAFEKENRLREELDILTREGMPCYDDYERNMNNNNTVFEMCMDRYGFASPKCITRRIIADAIAIYTFETCLNDKY